MLKGILAIALVLVAGCSHDKTKTDSSDSSSTPIGSSDFQMRPYQIQNLDNGLKIIWVRDTTLPVISLAMAIRAGGAMDPVGQEGLAEITSHLLDKGLPGRSALTIADQLEQRADSFGANVDADATFVGIRGLSFHAADTLHDFYELLTKPVFSKDEVERERKLMTARLERLVDRPSEFTSLVYEKFLFGDHPYAHDGVGTPASVAKIQRADIEKFHKQFYSPDHATLAVVGQFDDAYKAELVKVFSQWKKSDSPLATIPVPSENPGLKILAVEKPQMQQTEVRMGHIGVKRNIPDYLPLKVATAILGDPGSFTARLITEIRIKRGLTYGVHATFDPRIEPGAFEISTFTRNEKIHEMVQELLSVFKNFHDVGVTAAEVDAAKSALKGRFPRLVETGDDLAHQLLLLDLNGVSFDYLKNFQRDIDKVTTAEVNAAIASHFRPQDLKIVVFGPEGTKDMESLKDFGPVSIEDYRRAL